MKILKLIPFFLVAFLFCNYTAIAQEEEEEIMEDETVEEESTITGVYKGIDKDDGTYVFSYIDEDGEESTISFDKISTEAEQLFDLKKKAFVGKSFIVTYSIINEESEDEEGEIEYISVKTILTLTPQKA